VIITEDKCAMSELNFWQRRSDAGEEEEVWIRER
jgi:hypothetical protein